MLKSSGSDGSVRLSRTRSCWASWRRASARPCWRRCATTSCAPTWPYTSPCARSSRRSWPTAPSAGPTRRTAAYSRCAAPSRPLGSGQLSPTGLYLCTAGYPDDDERPVRLLQAIRRGQGNHRVYLRRILQSGMVTTPRARRERCIVRCSAVYSRVRRAIASAPWATRR